MDEKPRLVDCDTAWAENFARKVRKQRERVDQFLDGDRRRRQSEAARGTTDIQPLADAVAASVIKQLGEQREQLAGDDELNQRLVLAEENLSASVAQVAELERILAEIPQGNAVAADPDLPDRYEMAMEDLRHLKRRNEQLQRDLDNARENPIEAGFSAPETLDWEAQKQRMLATLEAEFDENEDEDDEDHEEARRERQKIEDIVQRTDQVIADKEQELTELRQVLEGQAGSIGSMAVGAAAIGEMLDQDEIIHEEREKLRQIQREWEEKLRQAEVDTSIERAKLARQRADLETKLRLMEEHAERHPTASEPEAPKSKSPSGGSSGRGRWLARLGLKDNGDS